MEKPGSHGPERHPWQTREGATASHIVVYHRDLIRVDCALDFETWRLRHNSGSVRQRPCRYACCWTGRPWVQLQLRRLGLGKPSNSKDTFESIVENVMRIWKVYKVSWRIKWDRVSRAGAHFKVA
jgi:hypothetical protein